MMRQIPIIVFLCFLQWAALAQNHGRVSGYVSTEEGVPLAFANVFLESANLGTSTNAQGQFSLSEVSPGRHTLLVTAIGFEKKQERIEVNTGEETKVTLICQRNVQELAGITVTAQKREEQLQNTPVPVTAISSRQIELYQLRTLSDLPALAPNLNIVDAGAPISQIPSIRGFNAYGGEPAVGIYVDGVVQMDGNFLNEQFVDVERIEVLRGPQGTLYGRNALGGAINIITKQPTNRFGGRAEAGFGNFGQQRYALSLNSPLVKDKLYLKTSGVYERRDGFFTNEFDGRKYDGFQRYAGNIALQWNLATNWSVKLSGNINVDDHDGIYPYHTSIDDLRANGYTINLNEQQAFKRDLYRSALTIEHFGDKLHFTSISALSYFDSHTKGTYFEGDFSPVDYLKFAYTDQGYDSRVWMQELRLGSGDNNNKLEWITGLNAFSQNRNDGIVTEYGQEVPPPQSEEDPIPGSRFINYAENNNYGLAVFGQATYHFTEKFNITAGLRYDYEHREATTSFDFELPPEPPVNMQPENTVNANFNALTPKITLQYLPKDHLNFYAVFARGFRAGGMNVYTPDPSLMVYDPEFSDNYELGLKSSWLENRLRANLTGFVINWRDKQVTTLLPSQGGGFQQAILNTGLLNAQGVELELAFIPFKNFQVDYTFGYTHAAYQELEISPGESLEGNIQPFQPDYTSMLALQYNVRSKSTVLSGFVRGEWRALGRQYFDFENNSVQDPYSLFNAKAGVNYKNYGLEVWARNLMGEEYIQFGYAFLGFENYLLGAPRTFGATLTAKF